MASKPGLFTEWPWQKLGNFKYVILAPWVVHTLHIVLSKDRNQIDLGYVLILPVVLSRIIHNQIWISLSRFQQARSKHRIVDRGIEFQQVDREANWDDHILFSGIVFYLGYNFLPNTKNVPLWRADGALIIALCHIGPVEFLYYWFHRALHHHFLYSRYHSHHHASIVTEPITSVIHPFGEHVAYYLLFAIPAVATIWSGKVSIISYFFYLTYIDFMNNMGHCNFELVPKWLFNVFPPLKYLMYTPSFHSLHHTQFRTNYSLFMPFYDYIYQTMDKSSNELYESSIRGKDEVSDVVHLTHLTTLQSTYHLRLGFASLASRPYKSKWYTLLLLPIAWISMALTWIYGFSFIVERNSLKKLKIQTWAIPRYSFQYHLSWEKEAINDIIIKTILEAEEKGVKVMSLGLLNQAKQLNGIGEIYILKYPKLRLRIVDGSSLAVAIVLNSIPAKTNDILLTGKLSKVACAIATELCIKRIQVVITQEQEFYMLKSQLPKEVADYLKLSGNHRTQVWIVGDDLDDKEQQEARKGTKFIPFSQFPLRKVRKDCTYYSTPAMKVPEKLENMHSCENWLPRRVMSAARICGILHALEGWVTHECGNEMLDYQKIWVAALKHGFTPIVQH